MKLISARIPEGKSILARLAQGEPLPWKQMVYLTPTLSEEYGFSAPTGEFLGYELHVRLRRGSTTITISSDYGYVRCFAVLTTDHGLEQIDLGAEVASILGVSIDSTQTQIGREMSDVVLEWDSLIGRALGKSEELRRRLVVGPEK